MKKLFFTLFTMILIFSSCEKKTKTTIINETNYEGYTELTILDNMNFGRHGFPDFGYMVSKEEYFQKYSHEPVFKIKTDFPTVKPKKMPEFITKIDFKKEPKKYIEAVRQYGLEGNRNNWNPYLNKIRDWYHIPWLHPSSDGYSATDGNEGPPFGGTEGFHGLIKEAPVSALQLSPKQNGANYGVYAVTLINDMAGYAMGRMWKDPNNPNYKVLDKRYSDGGFPEGTVFIKLLFTDAPKIGLGDEIDYLVNPMTWNAYITNTFMNEIPKGKTEAPKRSVNEVHLLQMDISVRDPRANRSPSNPEGTGWVFGTFCYNGKLNKKDKFMNLVPVGLMWGNDPEDRTNMTTAFPYTKTTVNKNLKETVIFESDDLPPQHLGWNGRLDGPADLTTSSCISCHNSAGFPQHAKLMMSDAPKYNGSKTPPPVGGSDEWMQYYQNIECGESIDQETQYSTDFSFQVAISLQNYFFASPSVRRGLWASDYLIERVSFGRAGSTPSE